MTVTQRRSRPDAGGSDDPTEPGIRYTCDFCHRDITHTVRIKCAAPGCEEVDLCPDCFCEGREGQRHKAWHDYKVVVGVLLHQIAYYRLIFDQEQHSQPILTADWGADEELLLISGLILNGLGNWAEVAQHIGTRTKDECERHYVEVYLGTAGRGSDDGYERDNKMEVDGEGSLAGRKRRREFMPPMDRSFDINPDEFQAKKRARIEAMRKPQALPSGPIGPLVSAPTNHEVAGFMPGRLEFEHEVENDAEYAVKDFEFGLVWKYGGDEQPEAHVTGPPAQGEGDATEDEDDERDKEHGVKQESEVEIKQEPMDDQPEASGSGLAPGESGMKFEVEKKDKGKAKAKADGALDKEDEGELDVKLSLLDIYLTKLDKREEAKEIIFDRGLTEHKRIQASERKRPKDERELLQRYKVFAKLQTGQDFEVLVEGIVYEQVLRKRIADLQEYRRMGVTTGAEAETYDNAKAARAGYRPMAPRERTEVLPPGRVNAGQHRFLYGTPPPGAADHKRLTDSREMTPRFPALGGRKPATPLNLANAASLDLLSYEEQSLCSSLRVLPKPYLTIKEMYIRENERRKGLLKRRDARRMMKIDVNKSGKIFDFLVSSGLLMLAYDPTAKVYSLGQDAQLLGMTVDFANEGRDGTINGLSDLDGVHEIRPPGEGG